MPRILNPAALVPAFVLAASLVAQPPHRHGATEHDHGHVSVAAIRTELTTLLAKGDHESAIVLLADEAHHLDSVAPIERAALRVLCAELCRARGHGAMAAAWLEDAVVHLASEAADDLVLKPAWIDEAVRVSPDPLQATALREAAKAAAGTSRSSSPAAWAGLAAAARRRAPGRSAASSSGPIELGHGRHRYEWVPNWAKLPEGMSLGNTHGCIAVDRAGRVYVNTDTERAIMVFEPDGRFVKTIGDGLAGGLHGMILETEVEREVLYLAHHGRHEALKMSLDGEILLRLPVPMDSGIYKDAGSYRPTSIAVALDGRIFVADGYGASVVHRYDQAGKYLGTFGTRGSDAGQFQTPHGLWLGATGGVQSLLLVADRENHRLQTFDLDGRPSSIIGGDLRRPCNVAVHGSDLAVADLAGRVTILDAKGRVYTHLGDQPDPKKRAQNGVPANEWKDGEFISPHSVCFDADGNLYVMDWLALGRITKLRRVPR